MAEQKLAISGMHCLDCARKVEGALEAVPGVLSVDVKYVRKAATVTLAEGTPLEPLIKAVEEAGYGAKPA